MFYVFVFFGHDPAQTQKVIISARGTNQLKRDGYVIQLKCVNTKQKIVQGRGPSNINLLIFVCSL